MDSGQHVSNGRVVCRYFSTKGECFYGPECQYLHQSPNSLPAESKLSRWLPDPSTSAASSVGVDHSKPNGKFVPRINSAISYGGATGAALMSSAAVQAAAAAAAAASVLTPAAAAAPYPLTSPSRSFTGLVTQLTQLPAPQASYFVGDDLLSQLLHKQALILALPNPNVFPDVPNRVESFQDLCPLDDSLGQQSFTFRTQCSVFKATDMRTGEVVALRRIHNFTPTAAWKGVMQVIESWKKIACSNIITLRHVFVTKDFGDTSLVFVHDYFPGAKSLKHQYFANNSNASSSLNGTFNRPYSQQQAPKMLPEALIWNFIIQLSSAIRIIHLQGLACRCIDVSKILVTSGCLQDPLYITNHSLQQQIRMQPRLRLSCSGVADVLLFDPMKDVPLNSQKAALMMQQHQQEDLLAFGKLCLSLACNSLQVTDQSKWQSSLELVSRTYSSDLRSLICHLLTTKPNANRNINDIMPMIGARFYAQLDLSNQRYDLLESELSKELDNSRLFRLLCKLGSINERPEHKMDTQWAETGDRYLIKLFRDYLFYQVSEEGRPLLDLSHIITNLNKLEQASSEKVCLVSRDEQNVLIVSYAELKKCFDSSFEDLFPTEPQR